MGVRANYTEEFERFWTEYAPRKIAPNASKFDAFKAWNQVAKERPPLETLLSTLSAYKASLKRPQGRDCFAKHPASWLRGRGWEPFLEAVEANISYATAGEALRMWNGHAAHLVTLIGPAQFLSWFKDSSLTTPDNGDPVEIHVPNVMQRDWIQCHFRIPLEKVFGECVVELSERRG